MELSEAAVPARSILSEKVVPAVGPEDAKILICGEAPGASEDVEGIPFSGMAGKMLNTMLSEAGIDRSKCYLTNVVNQRPEGNDFSLLYNGKEPSDVLKQHIERLRTEIELVKPNIIICLGNEALRAITGREGISKLRGSILSSSLCPGRKVVGTYHPAAVMRFFEWRPVTIMDLARGLRESEYPDIRTRVRTLHVGKEFAGVRESLERIASLHESTKIAFDIETSERQVTAISFSTHADSAISVPFFWKGASCFAEDEELILWGLVKKILEGPTRKIAQNAEFDCLFLWEIYGIKVANLWMDTMLAHHVVYPELEKGLAFLCSMYTDQPYYKDDIASKDHDVYLRYNALDSCITWECAEAIEQELKEFKVEQFYFGFVHKLIVPLTELGHRGIKIDMPFREATQVRLKTEIAEFQAKLDAAAGHPLNVNSPKQMQAYL